MLPNHMPFGKYRGQRLSEIPDSYLEWVLYEADFAKPYLKNAIREELERRADTPGETRHNAEEASLPVMRSVIKSWYREMALKYHPDRTLDNGAAMKAINHGYERLQELLNVTR
jgi:hypothetical protein